MYAPFYVCCLEFSTFASLLSSNKWPMENDTPDLLQVCCNKVSNILLRRVSSNERVLLYGQLFWAITDGIIMIHHFFFTIRQLRPRRLWRPYCGPSLMALSWSITFITELNVVIAKKKNKRKENSCMFAKVMKINNILQGCHSKVTWPLPYSSIKEQWSTVITQLNVDWFLCIEHATTISFQGSFQVVLANQDTTVYTFFV